MVILDDIPVGKRVNSVEEIGCEFGMMNSVIAVCNFHQMAHLIEFFEINISGRLAVCHL